MEFQLASHILSLGRPLTKSCCFVEPVNSNVYYLQRTLVENSCLSLKNLFRLNSSWENRDVLQSIPLMWNLPRLLKFLLDCCWFRRKVSFKEIVIFVLNIRKLDVKTSIFQSNDRRQWRTFCDLLQINPFKNRFHLLSVKLRILAWSQALVHSPLKKLCFEFPFSKCSMFPVRCAWVKQWPNYVKRKRISL